MVEESLSTAEEAIIVVRDFCNSYMLFLSRYRTLFLLCTWNI